MATPDILKTVFNTYTNYPGSNTSDDVLRSVTAAAVSGITGGTGISSLFASTSTSYATLEMKNLRNLPGLGHQDFRAMRALNTIVNPLLIRIDGASAALRGSARAGLYTAAAANPYGGAYALFNLNAVGKFGYGWGNQGSSDALRIDFTARSHVASKWKPGVGGATGSWGRTSNPVEWITPFRGDHVNVIDYGRRTLNTIYSWRRPTGVSFIDKSLQTQDFIKFFFTGPSLTPVLGDPDTDTDDVIVFRASINSLSDSFNPNWQPQQMVGRADSNYHYTGFSREVSVDFTVAATDRDEMKPIWRKLNALAGYTAPDYGVRGIAYTGPWMRVTIGDLYYQQAAIITSLSYTLNDSDTTWEINIENDPDMMQLPQKVTVSMGLTLIGNELPQKNGRFYSLSHQKKRKNWDWLADAKKSPSGITPENDTSYYPSSAQPKPQNETMARMQRELMLAELQRG
jgi:hypothetical protein